MSGISIKIPKGNDAIPFPRTSGGRFCGLGQLVCFGWAYSVQISNVGKTSIDGSSTTNNVEARLARTPRALSALNDTSHLMTTQIQKVGSTPPYTSGKISASVRSTSSDGSAQQVSSLSAAQVMSNICRQTSRVSFDTNLSLMTRVSMRTSHHLVVHNTKLGAEYYDNIIAPLSVILFVFVLLGQGNDHV